MRNIASASNVPVVVTVESVENDSGRGRGGGGRFWFVSVSRVLVG